MGEYSKKVGVEFRKYARTPSIKIEARAGRVGVLKKKLFNSNNIAVFHSFLFEQVMK
jgi:hypothetical protein